MDTRFHDAVEYALLSLRQGGITKQRAEGGSGYPGNLRWTWYVVGEYTACYPENLQNYLVHVQAVDTRPSSPHARGPGNEASNSDSWKVIKPADYSSSSSFFLFSSKGSNSYTKIIGAYRSDAQNLHTFSQCCQTPGLQPYKC